jgi:hypothetical protein
MPRTHRPYPPECRAEAHRLEYGTRRHGENPRPARQAGCGHWGRARGRPPALSLSAVAAAVPRRAGRGARGPGTRPPARPPAPWCSQRCSQAGGIRWMTVRWRPAGFLAVTGNVEPRGGRWGHAGERKLPCRKACGFESRRDHRDFPCHSWENRIAQGTFAHRRGRAVQPNSGDARSGGAAAGGAALGSGADGAVEPGSDAAIAASRRGRAVEREAMAEAGHLAPGGEPPAARAALEGNAPLAATGGCRTTDHCAPCRLSPPQRRLADPGTTQEHRHRCSRPVFAPRRAPRYNALPTI